uniref:HECT domain-containing protein n=1 Tax=Acanthochromis polyacanthus TaxID=80966 RepID=A0A3Q1GR54_9TELE
MLQTPMLQQIRDGMRVYNLLEVIGMHPTLCSHLYVPKEDDRPDSDYIMNILAPVLSEKGSPKRAKENSIINFFQDFLQDLEVTGLDEEHDEGNWSLEQQESRLSVPSILQWLTGQRHKPLLPSDRATFKINVEFDHHCNERMPGHSICFPVVSTNTVTFPVEHMQTSAQFRHVLTMAIRMGRVFSRV